MEERDFSSSRSAFAKEVLLGHGRIWIIALVSAVFFADDFSEKFIKPRVCPEVWTKYWEWLTVIGSLPIYVWAIAVLLILLVGVIESSFRLYGGARRRGDQAILALENYKTRQLELT